MNNQQQKTPRIAATLTRDRHGAPLVELEGGPFNGFATSPAALRELAGQLDALARLAASRPTGGKCWQALHVEMRTPVAEPAKAVSEVVNLDAVEAVSASFAEIFSEIFNQRAAAPIKKAKKPLNKTTQTKGN